MNNFDLTPVEEAIASAQTIAIILPTSLNQDKVAAALSLYLSLKKAQKEVSVICSLPMTVEYSSLVGVDKIKNKIKGRNLVVAFEYHEDSIEKVSYHIENNKFNLVIQPKEGFPPLSTDKVEYSYLGIQADVILTIGAFSWDNLGQIYFENKTFFEENKSINFDINPANKQFAKINLVSPEMASLSEMVTLFLSAMKLTIDEDMATNLLLGIKKATQDFSLDKSTPNTFEAMSLCLRAGGRKPLRESFSPQAKNEVKNLNNTNNLNNNTEVVRQKPSPDWYKPKIYKSDTKI